MLFHSHFSTIQRIVVTAIQRIAVTAIQRIAVTAIQRIAVVSKFRAFYYFPQFNE